MTTLDRLMSELCPNGVEYRKLDEIVKILNGYAFKSEKYVDSGIRVIRISDVQKGKMSDKDLKYYPTESENEIVNYLLCEHDLVMSLTGNVGRVAMLSKSDLPAGLNQRVACIRVKDNSKLLTRYLFHYFDQNCFEQNAVKYAAGGGQKNMSTVWLSNQRIPLPPLPVQSEIVRILDNFTELTAKLTTELAARKKQYEYYRNKVLTFGDDDSRDRQVQWLTLGEIGTMIRGSGLQKSDFFESGVGCIHYGQIYTHYGTFASETKSFVSPELAAGLKKVNTGDLIIAVTSETMEDVCKCVAWLGENEIVAGGHSAIFKHEQNPKYIAYYLQTSAFFAQKRKIAYGTKVIEVSPKKLESVVIPVPSLAEQERIVAMLDRFDDITSGLPAEIAARQKQYEYYRDKLLTFKEKEIA